MMHKALKAKTFKSQHEFHKSSHHSVSSAVFGQLRQLHLRQLSLTGFSQQSKELHGFSVLGFSWLRRVWSPLVSEPHAKDIWISGLSFWRFIGCCPFLPLYHFQSRRQRVIHGSPRNHRHPQGKESRNAQNVP